MIELAARALCSPRGRSFLASSSSSVDCGAFDGPVHCERGCSWARSWVAVVFSPRSRTVHGCLRIILAPVIVDGRVICSGAIATRSAAQRRASCSSTQGAKALRSRVQCAPVQSTLTRSWSSSSSDPFSMKSKSSCVATPSASGFGSAVSLAFFFSLDFDFAGLLRCTPRLVQARSVRWVWTK